MFSLSGHRGALASYPCKLYWAKFSSFPKLREKNKWFTKEKIIELRNSESPGLMISPVYLDFLFSKLPGGLEGLEYSVSSPIDYEPLHKKIINFLGRNKEWIIALIVITAAVIALIREVLK